MGGEASGNDRPVGTVGNVGDVVHNIPMYAYLDAGTGSVLLAAFAGGAAGIAVLGRVYWHRFLGIFSKKHRAAADAAAAELVGDPAGDDA